MIIFRYDVEYYSEYDKETFVNRGYTMAETFAEAMEKVTKHFGEEAIGAVILTPVAADSVIELKEDNIADANLHTFWKGSMLNEGF